jgi:flagellar hook-associated protein 1
MSDMLSNGVSGLLAFQQALSTISHNISNANTAGYSRQSVNLVTNSADPTAGGWIGNGVAVASVTRSYDTFLSSQTRTATSSYHQLNTVSTLAGSINNLFGSSTTGLSATLQGFSSAVQTLTTAPGQTANRQAVLNQAQTLINQFQGYESNLGQLDNQVNTQLSTQASTISSLASGIATLNQQIQAARAQSQATPNDLLDQRDNLIDQLSQHVGVSTVTQSDGSVSVFIGSGQPLVIGTTAAMVTAGPDQYNSGQSRLSIQTTNGSTDITDSLSGGAVGGLLQFREQMLIPAHNALGQAAVTLTSLVNNQNAAGLDQTGAIGAALLAVGGPLVLASSNNQGGATVSAAVSNLGGLTTSNYHLGFDGSTWTLTEAASGVATPLTSSTSGATTTLTGAGLTLTVTGSAQAGDQFLVEPTSQAVQGLSLLTNDPARIAAAAPLLTSAASTNTGNAAIDQGTVPSMAAWVRGHYTLSFSSPTAYAITDSSGNTVAAGAYTSGAPISFNGIQVTVSGPPASGDQFAIDDNANGTGDNRNALQLAGLLHQKVLNNGQTSLSDTVNAYVGTVGLQTNQAQTGATAQQSVLTHAQSAQQSVSGVNLDEEAANMLKFEQAYQAAAQVIKASDTLFQSLMTAVRA